MRMMFLDEAGKTFPKNLSGRYDLGDTPASGFLRSARKIDGDTSVVMNDQQPSGLCESIMANCENVLCFALGDSRDIRAAGDGLG